MEGKYLSNSNSSKLVQVAVRTRTGFDPFVLENINLP